MADFAAIQKHLDAKQHEKALTLVQDGLKALKDDSDLLHLQATLLLQLKKYDECASLCATSRPFEAAYAMYRLGQHAKVLQAAAAAGDDSPQWKWLQAQAQFRSGDMSAAQSSYSALQASSAAHDAQVEATVNYTAACIEGGAPVPDAVQPQGGADFEVAFNVATAQLASGDAAGAAAALAAALSAARAALLAEGLSAQEADEELLPLQLQSAVAQLSAGDAAGAAAVLRAAQRGAPRRSQGSYVAAVNAAVAGGSKELFPAFTAVKAALAGADDAKLSAAQRRVLQVNRALLLAHMGKGGEAAALGQRLLQEGGGHEAHLEALLAALEPATAGPAAHQRVAAAAALAGAGRAAEAATALREAAGTASEEQLPALVAAYVHWALQGGAEAQAVAEAAVALLAARPAGAAVVAARAAAVRTLHGAAEAAAAALVLESGSIGTDTNSALLGTLVRAASGSVAALPPAPPGATPPPLASLATGALPWSGTSSGVAPVAPPSLPASQGKAAAGDGAAAAAAEAALSPAEARASRRQAARLRRRAKLREAHMDKLRNKAVYRSGAAIPKPDPERWLPFKARSYDKFGNLKRRPKAGAAAAAYKNTGSSQGLAGSDSAKAASALDAKAAADAKGSAGAAAGGAAKGSTKAAPKLAAGLGKKKKRGKRR